MACIEMDEQSCPDFSRAAEEERDPVAEASAPRGENPLEQLTLRQRFRELSPEQRQILRERRLRQPLKR